MKFISSFSEVYLILFLSPSKKALPSVSQDLSLTIKTNGSSALLAEFKDNEKLSNTKHPD